LFERRGGRRLPIASTTKVMTALIVLESTTPFEVVVVSERAAAEPGARLGLRAGERIEVRQLLQALMLQSANDAAVALAEHVSGSVERFVRRMNRRARALGLRRTRFASPNGLDDRGRSTARDLARLTVEAMRHERFAEIVATKRHRVPADAGPDRRVQNRNVLLWLYRGATGVKTGYTAAAGYCLVATAERRDLHLVAVVLGSPREAFSDTAALLNHGFRAYERRTLSPAGGSLPAAGIAGRRVPLVLAEEASAVLRRGEEVEREVRLEPGLRLPVREGQEVGTVTYTAGGAVVAEVPVRAAAAVEPAPVVPPAWWRRALDAVRAFFTAWAAEAPVR
ncbi:MAG TPA: D-alanyl-D-alanine carboxypeptidase family protein, partial [Actinomycetota bacterium]|nr:D-alanyl-D-alanine carboxypeptidase family protein [Actinomycetota bacterium]